MYLNDNGTRAQSLRAYRGQGILSDSLQHSDMSSNRKLPDPKKPMSWRVLGSIVAKLEVIVEIEKTKARAQGERADVVDAIDMPHVVNDLLADVTDLELAPWGGLPKDKEALKGLLEAVAAEAAPKQ